ncbi:hypothetical protein BJ170DRAFT_362739 [Xylariales sp. AK1849]|nr:hypothetical protein BJ170DRAFT_362739 [Xylariales sp. AK1849]
MSAQAEASLDSYLRPRKSPETAFKAPATKPSENARIRAAGAIARWLNSDPESIDPSEAAWDRISRATSMEAQAASEPDPDCSMLARRKLGGSMNESTLFERPDEVELPIGQDAVLAFVGYGLAEIANTYDAEELLVELGKFALPNRVETPGLLSPPVHYDGPDEYSRGFRSAKFGRELADAMSESAPSLIGDDSTTVSETQASSDQAQSRPRVARDAARSGKSMSCSDTIDLSYQSGALGGMQEDVHDPAPSRVLAETSTQSVDKDAHVQPRTGEIGIDKQTPDMESAGPKELELQSLMETCLGLGYDESSVQSGPTLDLKTMIGPSHPFFRQVGLLLDALQAAFYTWQSGNGEGEADQSSPPVEPSAAKPQRIPVKRGRPLSDDEQSSDERQPTPRTAKKPKADPQGPSSSLACPYFKKDPCKHFPCLSKKITKISYLKQHLERCHKGPTCYCPTCGTTFDSRAAVDEHVIARSCQPRPYSHDGTTEDQRNEIAIIVTRKRPESERWYGIWDVLFPGSPQPDSPYLLHGLAEIIMQVRTFCLGRPGLIMSFLRDHGMGLLTGGNPNDAVSMAAFHFIEAGLIERIFNTWLADAEARLSRALMDSSSSSTSHYDQTNTQVASTVATTVNNELPCDQRESGLSLAAAGGSTHAPQEPEASHGEDDFDAGPSSSIPVEEYREFSNLLSDILESGPNFEPHNGGFTSSL